MSTRSNNGNQTDRNQTDRNQTNRNQTDRNQKNSGDVLIESLLKSIKKKKKLNAVVYVDDPSCDKHTLVDNPDQESKIRTQAVRKAIKNYKLNLFMEKSGSISVRKADLIDVHNIDYVDSIFKFGQMNKPVTIPKPSSEVSMSNIGSLESILGAVASVMGAVDTVCGKFEMKDKERFNSSRIRKVFCNVRPPGHHAHTKHGAGFCFMNNVAIGANFAMNKYKDLIKKVLIFDWDLHHGDGTQDIFKDNPNVMCVSFHRGGETDADGFYPFTGLVKSNDAGNIINFPISRNESIESYMKKFNEEFLPMAYKFDPDLVMISAGFDSHKDDLYHELPLDYCHFSEMTKSLAKLADECAFGRLVSVLEGGYTPDVLSKCVVIHIATMINGYDDDMHGDKTSSDKTSSDKTSDENACVIG